ncbi:hypothetical protein CXB51_033744 [Gossypium anomalum]|uniref:DUF4283 domain-containing protein n=1 Tax=Gossypium anomalum TaxID=47600 RepID=A0A8J5XRW9_9ROSI|nr:hypothetical protein CXB51_033744 [Gossypium anomalum]
MVQPLTLRIYTQAWLSRGFASMVPSVIYTITKYYGRLRLDFNTDNRARGKFAQMIVFVNLSKPLISQILINDVLQLIEYESFPVACFSWGQYGYGKELCPTARTVMVEEEKQFAKVGIGESNTTTESTKRGVDLTNYGP